VSVQQSPERGLVIERAASHAVEHRVEDSVLEQWADVYRDLGLSPPSGRIVEPTAIPRECRRLLVHRNGMTRTLEGLYRQSLSLEVLRSARHGSIITRQVLLVLQGTRMPVEMALIRIHLENLPEAARLPVLHQTMPLGTILRMHGVMHEYSPHIYFAVAADPSLREHADVNAANPLYGRRVMLSGANGAPVADAIEINIPVVGHP
jgi:chorismate-pyruvate lyase